VNHRPAYLVLELLGAKSTCGGHAVGAFSSTAILRGPLFENTVAVQFEGKLSTSLNRITIFGL